MTVRRAALFFASCAVFAAGNGCGSKTLETGYQYTPLSASPQQRRAYYAGPFSPEARNAAMSEDSASPGTSRRPNQ